MKTRNRWIPVVVLMLICFFFTGTVGLAAPQDDLMEKQLERLDISQIEDYWNRLMDKYGGVLPADEPSLFDVIKTGGKLFSPEEFLKTVAAFLFGEIAASTKLLGSIILLAIFAMILQTMQNAFEHRAVSTVAYAIVYMVLMVLAINSFRIATQAAQEAIQTMSGMMVAIIPLVLALMASMGNFTSIALFHPVIVFLVNTISLLVSSVIFPLIFLSAILHLVSHITDKYRLTYLANLLRNTGIGFLGVCLTVFLTVISVQGATAAVADGITIRTAKFITGNFIPVVGRMVSDAADTVAGASLLLKNAVGLVGVSVILLIVAFPALKILTMAFIYQLSAALMQPLGTNPIIASLNTIGRSLLWIFAALAVVSVMFFLTLTIIIAAGNLSLMIR